MTTELITKIAHTHEETNATYIQWNFSKRNIMQIEKRTALENWLSLDDFVFSLPLSFPFNNFKRVIVASVTDKRKIPRDVNLVSVYTKFFQCIITDHRFEDHRFDCIISRQKGDAFSFVYDGEAKKF